MSPPNLHARLSAVYGSYFAVLGLLLPFWSLYLQSLGLSPARIGELAAIPQATKLVAPNLWGWWGDVLGRRMALVRLASVMGALSFVGVFFTQAYWGLALVMLAFSFFWNAGLPLFEATTLNHLGQRTHLYSRIRLWGSVGFILAAALGGVLVEGLGVGVVPGALQAMLLLLAVFSLSVPEAGGAVAGGGHGSLGAVLRRPAVLALLAVCFFNQASHGPYYAFFSIYLENLGYRAEVIGLLWVLGVVAEIGVFMFMHRLLPRFGARRLMLLSLALTALRWLLIAGLARYWPVLLLAQTLHAFSFGMYHAVAIHLVHQLFTGPHQGRGQALYSSLSFGAGGALGSLTAGYLWVTPGPAATFALAALLSGVGLLVAWRWLQPG